MEKATTRKAPARFPALGALAAWALLCAPASIARAQDLGAEEGTPAPGTTAPEKIAPAPKPAAPIEPAEPAAPAEPSAAPAAGPTDEAAAPAAAPEPAPVAPVRGGSLDPLSGVRLGPSGRHQIAHVIARRMERGAGKHELAVTMPVQVNGKFTEHLGNGLEYRFHFREPIAIGAGGTYFWRGVESGFTEDELINKAKQQPYAADAVLLQWEGHAGIELAPIYGKFTLVDAKVMQFGMYLGTGIGAAQTRVQLRPEQASTTTGGGHPRTYGDTGLRPTGYFDIGMRLFMGQRFALNLEVRDFIYSDQVTQINGCNAQDLKNLDAAGANCRVKDFLDKSADGAIAQDLVKEPSSSVLHNVSFIGSLSVLF